MIIYPRGSCFCRRPMQPARPQRERKGPSAEVKDPGNDSHVRAFTTCGAPARLLKDLRRAHLATSRERNEQ